MTHKPPIFTIWLLAIGYCVCASVSHAAVANSPNGPTITNLNASNVASGTLANARLSSALQLLGAGDGSALTNVTGQVVWPVSAITNAGTAAYSNSAAFQRGSATLSNVVSLASNLYVGAFTGNGVGLTNITGSGTNVALLDAPTNHFAGDAEWDGILRAATLITDSLIASNGLYSLVHTSTAAYWNSQGKLSGSNITSGSTVTFNPNQFSVANGSTNIPSGVPLTNAALWGATTANGTGTNEMDNLVITNFLRILAGGLIRSTNISIAAYWNEDGDLTASNITSGSTVTFNTNQFSTLNGMTNIPSGVPLTNANMYGITTFTGSGVNGVDGLMATNFLALATNYVAANFVPMAGFTKVCCSNGIFYAVSESSTNALW